MRDAKTKREEKKHIVSETKQESKNEIFNNAK